MSDQAKGKGDLVALQDPVTGKFVEGNPGRPVGSKNRITMIKAALEEGFREENFEKIRRVLDDVVEAALKGGKMERKMVWDIAVSKGLSVADKEGKTDKGFTVHHMHHDINDDKGKDDE